MSRRLATIRTIRDLQPIPGADKIERATVDGWNVVVQKGEFQLGDLAVYCEIDSWIPQEVAPFLSKGKSYKGIVGERLRTVVIRGQLSQGLLLKVPPGAECGADVTDALGIIKFEVEAKATAHMLMKGAFPAFIPKTHQERVQNIQEGLTGTWEVTEKLDGSSMTVYCYNGEFGVCSHNIELQEDAQNAFWRAAKPLLEKLEGRNLALQGELVGPKIQNNRYKLDKQTFFLFDIFDIMEQRLLLPRERMELNKTLGIQHVPVFSTDFKEPGEALHMAERKSMLCPEVDQEGFVFKCNERAFSFKAISNAFLIKIG